MTVTRDVVLDLLPLYLADEVSADTRRLVEEYLRQDPQLARIARAGTPEDLLPSAAAPPSDAARREALERTRRLLARKQVFLAGAIVLSLLPLSFGFVGDGVVWAMWRDDVGMAVGFVGAALVCWVNYFRLRSQLQVTGL